MERVRIPFADFDDMDGHDITAIVFVGGPQTGKFRFQLDDVKLR